MTTPLPNDDTQSQTKRYSLGIALTCPHCSQRALIRTSRSISETYREAWAICPSCGFKGKAHVAWDAEASPSLLPNMRVTLPRIDYRDAVEQFAGEIVGEGHLPQLDMFSNSG